MVLMKGLLIFGMPVAGAAVYIGVEDRHGAPVSGQQGKDGAAPTVWLFDGGAGDCDEKPTDWLGRMKPNQGCGTAYRRLTKPGVRCCCYETQPIGNVVNVTEPLGVDLVPSWQKCYDMTDDDIKGALAASKERQKIHMGQISPDRMGSTPWAMRKGYSAIRHLVDEAKDWCPDVQSLTWLPRGEWCPSWHSDSWTLSQVSPTRFGGPKKASKEMCNKEYATTKNPVEFKATDCLTPGPDIAERVSGLVEKVNKEYTGSHLCCCYTYSYPWPFGDYDTCFTMWHEDIRFVQEQLKVHKEDGGMASDKPKEPLGLGENGCPRAYWTTSWEIKADGARDALHDIGEYFKLLPDDKETGQIYYLCPTFNETTVVRNMFGKWLYLAEVLLGFRAFNEEYIQEPENWGGAIMEATMCPNAIKWDPALCY